MAKENTHAPQQLTLDIVLANVRSFSSKASDKRLDHILNGVVIPTSVSKELLQQLLYHKLARNIIRDVFGLSNASEHVPHTESMLLAMEQPESPLTAKLADKLIYHPKKSYRTLNLSRATLQTLLNRKLAKDLVSDLKTKSDLGSTVLEEQEEVLEEKYNPNGTWKVLHLNLPATYNCDKTTTATACTSSINDMKVNILATNSSSDDPGPSRAKELHNSTKGVPTKKPPRHEQKQPWTMKRLKKKLFAKSASLELKGREFYV